MMAAFLLIYSLFMICNICSTFVINPTILQYHYHCWGSNNRFQISNPLQNNKVDVCNEEPIVTPVHLLSSEERNQIDELVMKRSEARWNGDYTIADAIRSSIDDIRVVIPLKDIIDQTDIHIKDGLLSSQEEDVHLEYKVVVTDIPRCEGGKSSWELVPINNSLVLEDMDQQNEDNVLQLAHAALGMAVSASERGRKVDTNIMNELVGRDEYRLRLLKQRKAIHHLLPGAAASVGELHGRKAADAILWFALAGIGSNQNDDLFHDLVDILTMELQRFGRNSSCRAKDVLHIVERVAMAGVVGESTKQLYNVAADCLEIKMRASYDDKNNNIDANKHDVTAIIDYSNTIQSLRDNSFGLHSDRSLLGLWRFSTRQRKQKAFLLNSARHFEGKFREYSAIEDVSNDVLEIEISDNSRQYDWSSMFTDPTRPLVVDVGCGMGVSLLGLASSCNITQPRPDSAELQIDWSKCNFIGADLSRLAIGYAQSIRDRWDMSNLAFVVDSAEDAMDAISESYPGLIELVMVQFPTPYRLNDDEESSSSDGDKSSSVAKRDFNSQLPEAAASANFMVSENLISQIHNVLSNHSGQLLIQSNCEDVAVHMKNVASRVGFQPSKTFSNHVVELDVITQRQKRWVDMGGERAIGSHWASSPLLPVHGRTETEVACLLDSKPVHRCLLKAKVS